MKTLVIFFHLWESFNCKRMEEIFSMSRQRCVGGELNLRNPENGSDSLLVSTETLMNGFWSQIWARSPSRTQTWLLGERLVIEPNTRGGHWIKPVKTHRKNTYFFLLSWPNKFLFPPSPYPMLFRITQELHTLGFRPKQLWVESWRGLSFFLFRGDGSMAQK